MVPYKPPKSISHWLDPFVIVAIILVVYFLLRRAPINNTILATIIVLSIGAVMGFIEYLRAPWSPFKARLEPARSLRVLLYETGLQWLGMCLNFFLIVFAWWLLGEYHRSMYGSFFTMLPYLILGAPIAAAFFLFVAEFICGSTRKGGRELGLFLVRAVRSGPRYAVSLAEWDLIRNEFFSWLLFGFFLPLNFVDLVATFNNIRGNESVILSGDWVKTQYYILQMIWALLIASILPGYLFGSRLIRTETRAVDHSWFGWAVTLICYDPLVSGVFGRWFEYRVTFSGDVWVRPWATAIPHAPYLLYVVGGLIIVCELAHLWGEAQFGLRSSNLSNRGVITAGLYRVTKHPVFVSKMASWMLMWVPFLAGGSLGENIRRTMLWGVIGVIYVLRALVEERVLSTDPDYIAYGLYMDKHSAFAWVGRLLPIMSFKYRLEKWQKPVAESYQSLPVVASA